MRVAIAEHHRPLKLSDLARSAAQSPFQLIRAFRRELGITPHALLVRVRVWRATARLMAGEPIASVATAVGFADQAHFHAPLQAHSRSHAGPVPRGRA